jgi:homoprotocatechuate degradation regulator HpaR
MSALREFSRSLPMALLRAREAVMERFRPLLRRHGVTEQQWRVLRALSVTPETSASALGEAACIGLPSLSRILRALEARRLIGRRVKSTDQRTTLVSLTAAGRRFLGKAGGESEERYEALAAEIGHDDLQQLYALLERVSAMGDASVAEPGSNRLGHRRRRDRAARHSRQGRRS